MITHFFINSSFPCFPFRKLVVELQFAIKARNMLISIEHVAEWLRRLTRKPKAVGSNLALDSLVAVRNSSPGRPELCEGNLVAAAGSCSGLMVKHPWPLLEISVSDFRRLTTLKINTYLPTYRPLSKVLFVTKNDFVERYEMQLISKIKIGILVLRVVLFSQVYANLDSTQQDKYVSSID